MYQIVIILLFIFIFYVLFYILTKKTRYVYIIKKFKINGNIMKILDDDGIEYIIEENLFISEKKCTEIWDFLNENTLHYITYYGCNYPVIGIKYRIINLMK